MCIDERFSLPLPVGAAHSHSIINKPFLCLFSGIFSCQTLIT
jgi:hypothetical protein